jgi:hypothetical protein
MLLQVRLLLLLLVLLVLLVLLLLVLGAALRRVIRCPLLLLLHIGCCCKVPRHPVTARRLLL